jgi:hypothetical protein
MDSQFFLIANQRWAYSQNSFALIAKVEYQAAYICQHTEEESLNWTKVSSTMQIWWTSFESFLFGLHALYNKESTQSI